nr:uncharacterized protein LOC119172799 [Rhipicephalus microplus]
MTLPTVMTAPPLFMLLLLMLRASQPDSLAVLAAPSAAPGNDTATATSATEATCESDADCRRLSFQAAAVGIACDASTRRCACTNRTLVLTRRGTCLPIRMLGQPCRRNEQCLKIDKNSECDNDYCKCKDGYYLFNDVNGTSCLPDVELQTMRPFGMDPKTDPGMSDENMVPIIVCLAIMFVGMCVALQLFSRCVEMLNYVELQTMRPFGMDPKTDPGMSEENMVPIIVCLAIMFVGMCVALQLFSRARFRNQRTIFNSPNPRLSHLKLSNKDSKRRHSHASLHAGSRRASACSQMSPSKMGSRVGSRAGSRAGSRSGSPDVRRSSLFQHHGEHHGSKDGAHTLINGPAESLQNGSPKVVVNRGRSPSPTAHA